MQTRYYSAPILAASLIALFANTNSVLAYDACDAYADSAVAQQRDNVQNRCAFDGLRWQGDRHAHKSYCQLVGPDVARIETNERDRMLNGCFAQGNNNNQASPTVTTFQCTGTNRGLRFEHTDDANGQPIGGKMYLNNRLIGLLDVRRFANNNISVRAKVRGLNTEFTLNTDRRKVYLGNDVVCQADVSAVR
jgi:hypothetical protein